MDNVSFFDFPESMEKKVIEGREWSCMMPSYNRVRPLCWPGCSAGGSPVHGLRAHCTLSEVSRPRRASCQEMCAQCGVHTHVGYVQCGVGVNMG